nr:hypothetical protein [Tanacetum cinerariifolium]
MSVMHMRMLLELEGDARVVVETVAREEVKTSARGTIVVSDDRVMHVVVSYDILEPAQEEGAIEVTYGRRWYRDFMITLQRSQFTEFRLLRAFKGIREALEARDATKNLEPLTEGGNEQGDKNSDDFEGGNEGGNRNGNGNGGVNENGNGGGNSIGNGNGNEGGNGYGNHNMNFEGFMPVARECTYQDFLKYQPLNFNRIEGVVGLTRWFEKMETWNSHKRTIGIDAANAMRWTEVMKLMTQVYCPRNEIQKMETEMVPDEEDKVERFIGDLPDHIQGNVIATEPTRLHDAIRISKNLMDKKLKGYARNTKNKRRFDNNSRDNRGQQPSFKRKNVRGQNVARAYTGGNNEKKGYVGSLPYCNKCKLHYEGPCTVKCGNCKRVGHMTSDCTAVILLQTLSGPQLRIDEALENQLLSVSMLMCLGKHDCVERIPSVSSDSSKESVGTSVGRVILLGTIPTIIPDTTPTVTSPTTHVDTTLTPIEIPTISPIVSPSPYYTPASPDYSPTSDTKPNRFKDTSSIRIPTLPATSPFLSSTHDSSDSDTPDTPPSPTHEIPPVEVAPPTSQIIPAQFGIHRRRFTIVSPGQPIPYGRPYRYHPNGPVHMMTRRKRVGPLPTHRLAVRHSVNYSSLDHFTFDDSSRDSPSDSS